MIVTLLRLCSSPRVALTMLLKSSNRMLYRHNCFSTIILNSVNIHDPGFSKLQGVHVCKVQCIAFSSKISDTNVTYEEVIQFQENKKIVIIDVREPTEIAETYKLPGSIHIPLGDVKFALESLSDQEFKKKYGISKPGLNTPLVFSCQAGKRSLVAMERAIQIGFKNVRSYGGGFAEWDTKSKKK